MSGAAQAQGSHLQGSHLPVLDGLRALSICLVLAAHLAPLGPKILQMNSMAGTMGMSLFFALSGYLITCTLREASVAAFLVRRVARLVPLAWLYLVVVWLIYPVSATGLVAGLLFKLNYWPDLMRPQTEHLWSLAVEMHFYLAIAVLAAIHRKAVALVWPLCFLVTALRIAEGAHLSIATHLRVDEILAGACVALLPEAWRRAGPASTSAGIWLWLAAGVCWAASAHPLADATQYARPYATALFLLLTLRLADGPVRRVLSARLPAYIASISYALYVIHPLMAHGWWNSGTLIERYLLKRPLGLAITIVLAHLSTTLWERRWISAARRWTARFSAPAQSIPAQSIPAQSIPARSARADAVAAAASPSGHRPVAE